MQTVPIPQLQSFPLSPLATAAHDCRMAQLPTGNDRPALMATGADKVATSPVNAEAATTDAQ
ncbi:hypothetical protein [Microbulbifer litoralis]|uniref:hypothetical protein n=1 Tax=Microbulbifer litoralis TaxID=2933965 RepID=UPI0020294325|nr:hypothetical protein [Microbulbifer sp. GX H0434]